MLLLIEIKPFAETEGNSIIYNQIANEKQKNDWLTQDKIYVHVYGNYSFYGWSKCEKAKYFVPTNFG